MDGIAYVVEEWERGNVLLLTSTITRVEVLDCKLTGDQADKFRATLTRRSVQVVDVTTPISTLAHEIRAHYRDKPGFKVKTPDAIHLATAIAMGCHAFQTFDGKSPKRKTFKRLLGLGPMIAERHPLRLEPPQRPPLPPPAAPPPPEAQASLFDMSTMPATTTPRPCPAPASKEAPGPADPAARGNPEKDER